MYFSTAKEMERLDEIAVENGLKILQMMELAGWHMVTLFGRLHIPKDSSVTIVCGTGNKGGDGLAAARHLHNHGYNVRVVLISENVKDDPAHHLSLLRKTGVPISVLSDGDETFADSDVIIDALIGYHLDGAPRDDFAKAIELINASGAHVISYDLPSGVYPDTGEGFDPHVKAGTTLTLALPKKLFDTSAGRATSGEVFVADIGIPEFLYDQIHSGSRPDFDSTGIVLV